MKLKKYLALLALTGLVNGGSAKNLTTPVPPPKTNNVLALNFVLTAWPNAAGAAPAPAARPSAASLRVAPPAGLLCAIQPAGDGTGDDGQLYYPIDPLLDDPGVVVELPPDDGSVFSGEVPVEDPTISEIRTFSPTAQSSSSVVTNGPFRLTSKDIIASFNGVTNNGATLNFGSGAQLLLKQIASRLTVVTNTLGTNRQIIVREKKSGVNVDTDVSRFFRSTVNYYATQTANNEVRNRKLTAFALVNPGRLSFTLAALVTEVTALPTNGVAVLRTVNWGAQGSGQLSGGSANLILGGQISGGAAKLE